MDSEGRPFTQSDHDHAVEVGGIVVWLAAVAIVVSLFAISCSII